MDFEHYSKYYSFDKLFEEIIKLTAAKKVDVQLQLEKLYADGDFTKLFNLVVEYGLDELAEYLYIFYGISFEINKLSKQSINTISNSKDNGNATTAAVSSGSSGSSTGLSLAYWNPTDKNKNIVVHRLTSLIKYSKMERRGKEFWYTFNPKWTNHVLVEVQ